MAQEVTVQTLVVVGGVLHPGQASATRLSLEGRPCNIEQRALEPPTAPVTARRHPGQAAHPAAAQGSQQEGLGLVIPVLGQPEGFAGRHSPGEAGVAGLSGRALDALP